MQTLSRAIKRGNAVIIHNSTNQQREVYWKRGLFWKTWLWALNQADKEPEPIRYESEVILTRWQRFVKWIRRILKWQ
jgi:hypothetical protein